VLSFAARHALVGGTGGLTGDAAAQGIALAVGLQEGGFSVSQMFGAGLAGLYAGAGNYVAMRNALKSCFAAGTPLRLPGGWRNIEDIRVGDLVLSRDENNCEGPVEAKVVEEVFVRESLVLRLDVNGRMIRTTAEHPFFVAGRGWVPCHELKVGDRLLTEDGAWVAVEAVEDTGEWVTVYNLRIADYHTYFVGCDEWGFSVWAHNQYFDGMDAVQAQARLQNEAGLSPAAAARIAAIGEQQGIHGNLLIDQVVRALGPTRGSFPECREPILADFMSEQNLAGLANRFTMRADLRTMSNEMMQALIYDIHAYHFNGSARGNAIPMTLTITL
jgi:hypothetical protein